MNIGRLFRRCLDVGERAQGGAFRLITGRDVDPAVLQSVKAVKGVEAILLFIGQRPLRLAGITREPGRTEQHSAV